MVERLINGNILTSPHTHIVFGVNKEGYNDAGFAGAVSSNDWPELANTGEQELGTVLHKSVEGRTYHAIVCHSLRGGWDGAPDAIERGINALIDSGTVSPDEEIGCVLIGAGMIGQMQGADVSAIVDAMKRSKATIVVYTL